MHLNISYGKFAEVLPTSSEGSGFQSIDTSGNKHSKLHHTDSGYQLIILVCVQKANTLDKFSILEELHHCNITGIKQNRSHNKKFDIPLLFWYYSKVMRKESNELRKIVKETS